MAERPGILRIGREIVADLPVFASFGSIAAISYYLLWMQQANAGTGAIFFAQCFPSKDGDATKTPFRLPYTGNNGLDLTLCVMVTFFDRATSDPDLWCYTWDLVGSLPVQLYPIFLECSSLVGNYRILAVALPLILGFTYSTNGGAIVFPIFWMLTLIVRSVQRRYGLIPALPDTITSQVTSLALLFGYIIPSIIMLYKRSPKVIATWVAFPVTIAVAQISIFAGYTASAPISAWLAGSKPSITSYDVVQTSYVLMGTLAFLAHLPLLFAIMATKNPIASARNHLFPHLYAYSYETREELFRDGLKNEIRRFDQWDSIFIALTTWLAGTYSWAFTSFALGIRVAAVSLVGSIFVGPGTVCAVVFMVKEMHDQIDRGGPLSGSRVGAEALQVAAAALSTLGGTLPSVTQHIHN